MGEVDGSKPSNVIAYAKYANAKKNLSLIQTISFDRQELREILGVYGRKVAAGEWRDYAIDLLSDRAVFSVFRRTSEFPLYRIEKNPDLQRKQGQYSIVAPGGLILKRGNELNSVLSVLEKKHYLSLVSA